ncbi:hypothetical protein BH09SUM1_BH09SUM1_14130 [soil metagenome]
MESGSPHTGDEFGGLPEDPAESFNPFKTSGVIKSFLDKIPGPGHGGFVEVDETIGAPLREDGLSANAHSQQGVLGAYRPFRIVGRGGFGEVWEADQPSLRRVVAVKRLREDVYADAAPGDSTVDALENTFRQEALTAARLDHPNIVPVYDLSMDVVGRPLLAMKLVDGVPWSAEILHDSSRLERAEFLSKHLAILLSVAQAVSFAHSRGVIHRDLKPSQVMLGRYGEVYLMDWGLALHFDPKTGQRRSVEDSLHGPQKSFVTNPAGTPAYMAPEQTRRTDDEIGPWTDIYLLGGTLYFLLAGAPPHSAPTSKEAVKLARTNVVPLPEEARPDIVVPSELSAIAMKSLSTDPADRCKSVTEFIAAIRDYQSGLSNRRASQQIAEEVQASLSARSRDYRILGEAIAKLANAEVLWPGNPRIPQLREEALTNYAEAALRNNDLVLARLQVERIENRTPRQALMDRVDASERKERRLELQRRLSIAGIGVLLLALIASGVLYLNHERDANLQLAQQRDIANDARLVAERSRKDALKQKDIAEEEQYYAGVGIAEVAVREGRLSVAEQILFNKTPEQFRDWEWGYLLASISPEDMTLHRGESYHAEFSNSGDRIVVGDRYKAILFDAATGRQLWSQPSSKHIVWTATFSPKDDMIGLSCMDRMGYLLNAETGETLQKLAGHTSYLRGGDFDPRGGIYATTSADKTIKFWKTDTAELIKTITPFAKDAYFCCYTPDGKRLLATSLDRTAVLIDTESGQTLQTFTGATESVLSAALTPDGKHVICASTDRIARIYNGETGELERELKGIDSFFHSVDISPDGLTAATSSDSGICALWNIATGEKIGQAQADTEMVKISFSPDGKRIVGASRNSVRVFSVDRMLFQALQFLPDQDPQTFPRIQDSVQVYGVPPNRSRTWDDADGAWNVPDGGAVGHIHDRDYFIQSRIAWISPDGATRLSVDPKSSIPTLTNLKTGEAIPAIGDNPIIRAAFSADGSLLAVAEMIGTVHVFQTSDWKEINTVVRDPEHKITDAQKMYNINGVAFAPDGRRLAICYLNGRVDIVDPRGGPNPILEIDDSGNSIICVSFSPDGKLIATGNNREQASLWNSQTGERTATLSGHLRTVVSAMFNPAGTRLVTTSLDHTVKLWDVESGREIMTLYTGEKGRYPLGAAFSKDGWRVFIPLEDHDLRVLEAFPWRSADYVDLPNLSRRERIELWKRRERVSRSIQPQDVALMEAE